MAKITDPDQHYNVDAEDAEATGRATDRRNEIPIDTVRPTCEIQANSI